MFLKMFRNLTHPGHLSQPLPIMNWLTYLNFSLFNKKNSGLMSGRDSKL